MRILLILIACVLTSGCGERMTRVQDGNRRQILHRGNGAEPQELDPHVVSGVPEHRIIQALLEGLVTEDPVDLHPVPGVAERWDISPDGLIYTFHLRANARWSNGDPVVASDFVKSYQRILTPTLASEYAYMLYPAKNAREFNEGKLTDFNEVGFKALDDRTLQVTLHSRTPYFLSLLNHYSWFPVHLPTIAKHGSIYDRGNLWTRPENFVGNGAFTLKTWQVNYKIVVQKNPIHWDAERVRLNEIHFYAIESGDTEERAFRSGQLHLTYQLGVSKIDAYKEKNPEVLRIDPYLGSYFYVINVTRPPFNDKRVRQALSLAIDRETIVKNVTRGGELPAYFFTPPDTAGYTCRTRITTDVEKARKLLAEAGYPSGAGMGPVEILYNTLERHKIVAESIQQMWKKNLNIEATLVNQEWKVYLENEKRLNYQVGRYGWIGDYVDPNSFLDIWITGGGNNRAGWSNADYDRLIDAASKAGENEKRFEFFQQAEAILLEEMPVIPIYFYTSPYLLAKSVRNWHPTILDEHPYKYVYLESSDEPLPSSQTPRTSRTAH